MDQKERIELIRRGNELFNSGDIKRASALFIKTSYRDGLTRIADYLYFDKRQPLNALPYYRMVNRHDRVNEIFERMVFALGRLLGKEAKPRVELPPLKVSPKLKIMAEEILRDNQAKDQR